MSAQRQKVLKTASYPIPPNTVAHISGANAVDMRTYVLWKDGQVMVIQANPLLPGNESIADIFPHNVKKYHDRNREYYYGLECIHSLINTLDFGKTNWGYLVPFEGNYQIVQKERRIPRIKCPTWAPLISESEIVFTSWSFLDSNKSTGIWRGREVDVLLGYDDCFLRRLDRLMSCYKLLEGLDLTYEILAHIVRNDSTVVGFVTEPEVGRLIQYRDKIPLIEAFAKLRSRRIIYSSIRDPFVHVLDGKVRLTNLAALHYIEEPHEFEEKAEEWHWAQMKHVFAYLDPNGETDRCCWVRASKGSFTLFSNNPSPERPLFSFSLGNHWSNRDGGGRIALHYRSKYPVRLPAQSQRNDSTFFHGRHVDVAHLARSIGELTRHRARRAVQPYSRQKSARKPLLITPAESGSDKEEE